MLSIDRRFLSLWGFIGLILLQCGICEPVRSHHPYVIRLVPLSTVYPRSEIDLALILKDLRRPPVQVVAPGNQPFLGITVNDAPLGAEVVSVVDGGPGDRLGLRPGDKVVRFENLEIDAPADLAFALRSAVLGKSVTIKILRHNNPLVRTICFLPERVTISP